MPTEGLLKGTLTPLIPALTAVGAGVNGAAFSLPHSRAGRPVTWKTTFATDPSAVSVRLQGAFDASNPVWFDIDTSTVFTAGETRTISGATFPNVQQVRARMETVTGGATFKVEIII